MYHYKPFIVANIFIALFLGFNIYLLFGHLISNLVIFWILLFVITQSYWIVRYTGFRTGWKMPGWLFSIVTTIFSVYIMALISAVFMDFVLLPLSFIPPVAGWMDAHKELIGVSWIVVIFLMYMTAWHIANTPRHTFYKIKKKVKKPVRIALLADIRIKVYTTHGFIKNLVKKVNEAEPDIIVIAGDIMDGEAWPFLQKGLDKIFQGLKPRLGTYAILGNHDYYGQEISKMIEAFEQSGFIVLRDKVQIFEEMGIALIGRDDYMSYMFGVTRDTLKELMEKAGDMPVKIVVEHQPRNVVVKEAMACGVDLMLAGHTHAGQIFPMNFLVNKLYIDGWGLWEKGPFSIVVTCGFGAWGTNVRNAGYSEVAVIDIEPEE